MMWALHSGPAEGWYPWLRTQHGGRRCVHETYLCSLYSLHVSEVSGLLERSDLNSRLQLCY
jgi:hypothetical protein